MAADGAAFQPAAKPSASSQVPSLNETPVEGARVRGPSALGRRSIIGLLWFASVATVAYWVIWFGVDRRWLATADSDAYYTFENAFPLADGWMAASAALAAIALQRRSATALLWMLLAASASLYLGGMDILFDLENGIYRHGDPGSVAVEAFINVGCLAGGVAIIIFAWRHRRHWMSLESPPQQ